MNLLISPYNSKNLIDFEISNFKGNQTQPISLVFRTIIRDFEFSYPTDINIIEVSRKYQIQHRRVYDFFNFLTSMEICSYKEKRRLVWIGVKNSLEYIDKSYSILECESLTKPFQELFSIGPSPSLGSLATKFICLYFYLGVKILSIRQVSNLFHDKKTDIKSLERRLYLVLSFLEIIGFIAHTSKRSEYQILIDYDHFVLKAFSQRFLISKDLKFNQLDLLLNRYSDFYFDQLIKLRWKEFQLSSQYF